MANRPLMPLPSDEPTPEELRERIQDWAASQGYQSTFRPASREYGAIVVTENILRRRAVGRDVRQKVHGNSIAQSSRNQN